MCEESFLATKRGKTKSRKDVDELPDPVERVGAERKLHPKGGDHVPVDARGEDQCLLAR